MRMFAKLYAVVLAAALPCGSSPAPAAEPPPHNTLTRAEKDAGWKLLFDGQTTHGWRGYKKEGMNPGWKVENGELKMVSKGGDIITTDQFEAFELVLDWKISKGGNSGLMFHVTEQEATCWMTGPEIQIQDNPGHDGQKAGWLYQLYKSEIDVVKPAGEWNTYRVLIRPAKSEVHVNGVKYYEFVKGSDDWNGRVAKSKFGKMANFGKPTQGHIALQDHGNEVSFRNIKIRPIAK